MATIAGTQTSDWRKIFDESFKLGVTGYGVPLWEPQPSSSFNHVTIGDVGYLSDGEFHRVLNIKAPGENLKSLDLQGGDVEKSPRAAPSPHPSPVVRVGGEKEVGDSATKPAQGNSAGPPRVDVESIPSDTESGNTTGLSIDTDMVTLAASPISPFGSNVPPASVSSGKGAFTSKGVRYESFTENTNDGCTEYTFKTSEPSGAIIIPLSALQEECLKPAKVSEWRTFMAHNLNDWPEPEACARRHLVLIHGRIMVSEWAIVVFDKWKTPPNEATFRVVIKGRSQSQGAQPEGVRASGRAGPPDGSGPSGGEPDKPKSGDPELDTTLNLDDANLNRLTPTDSKPEDGIHCEDVGKFHCEPLFRRGRDVLSAMQTTDSSTTIVPHHCLFFRGLRPTGNRGLLSGWTVEDIAPRSPSNIAPGLIKRVPSALARVFGPTPDDAREIV